VRYGAGASLRAAIDYVYFDIAGYGTGDVSYVGGQSSLSSTCSNSSSLSHGKNIVLVDFTLDDD
jgi:hypothetical protein